jgi:hypothetical protein
MDGLSLLLATMSFLLVLCVIGANVVNTLSGKIQKEGFTDTPKTVEQNPIAIRIRAVLDPMIEPHGDALCSLFDTIRKNMMKNEKAGQNISDDEARARVEKALALKIPGGPLPCPLLRYPQGNVSDIEWLNWLQRVPPDFGARIVFMATYAKEMLGSTSQKMKDALSGKTPPTEEEFSPICPPDVATTRRAERARKSEQACVLPENVSPERIQEQIQQLLETIIATKGKALKAKGINPGINIGPILQEAKQSQDYLEKQAKDAESGNLEVDIPSMD